ncbi:MAG: DUF2844 domain-containing protein [Acidobacteriia bacterium]|nr:DUF2844 domain-containing protein [Terriglobia bacterium]
MKKPLIALTALFVSALTGFAALGGSEQSVISDQVRLKASRRVVPEHGYRVHEISRDDGTLIKEYVSFDGKVFGVSWKGPTLPDLSQLLGSSFAEFQNSVHPKAGRRKAAVVHNRDLVVESTGHTRAFQGRAYLNSMLPDGVSQEVVQ